MAAALVTGRTDEVKASGDGTIKLQEASGVISHSAPEKPSKQLHWDPVEIPWKLKIIKQLFNFIKLKI